MHSAKKIGIIGGGPAGLFVYKKLIESGLKYHIDIFEARDRLGEGMPYSKDGASREHITNVSGNEIPDLMKGLTDWVKSCPDDLLAKYEIDKTTFTDFKVLPRLLFGEYLHSQFYALRQRASDMGTITNIHLDTTVSDIRYAPEKKSATVFTPGGNFDFDHVIICTGHVWPKKHENVVKGYFDSPYPPSKIGLRADHPVAFRGSSLTAIDAVRTLARSNGVFERDEARNLSFKPNLNSSNFKVVMHSTHGLLPGIRFHLKDPRLSNPSILTKEELQCHREENGGFISLDFVYEKDFKEPLMKEDPQLYGFLKDLTLEGFFDNMINRREQQDAFELFKAEYREAAISIERRESVYWKEMLAVLSFALNYPAKYLSAEDTLRLQKTIMPLISVIIAFVPQSSCEELIALHDAGRLEIVAVGKDSEVLPEKEGIVYEYNNESGQPQKSYFPLFVDSIGQPHLEMKDFPFRSLVDGGHVRPAMVAFDDHANLIGQRIPEDKIVNNGDKIYLKVHGLQISDDFEIIGDDAQPNPAIYLMAVPFIGGFNPDYSGLDFCEEASTRIIRKINTGIAEG